MGSSFSDSTWSDDKSTHRKQKVVPPKHEPNEEAKQVNDDDEKTKEEEYIQHKFVLKDDTEELITRFHYDR